MTITNIVVVIVIIVLVIWLVITNIRIVPQAHSFVIERLGAYNASWETGLHFKAPLIDKVSKKVSLKEHVIDFPPQPVITKDNVTINIDTVVYFQITDPKLYTYGADNPMAAIENLTATTLRNIIGDLELDSTLTSRDTINGKIRIVLDEATDPWGIKINRVEVKNIDPPREIQEAMEKQMRAEREKREAVLRAEGKKQSVVLVAEGNKESAILEAEGKKQAMIKNAEGEAAAIKMVQEATAEGIKMIVGSAPTSEVLTLKSLEAFQTAADGKATKIIIPSEIQGIAGLASSLTEIVKNDSRPAGSKPAVKPAVKTESRPTTDAGTI
ncbi:MAG: SPFH domain-containing protein [Eubacteriaceae bacterium]|nr:SPFH domain-containing protein [Eubacteriaceae bacterium]